jgi:hypothetical protein
MILQFINIFSTLLVFGHVREYFQVVHVLTSFVFVPMSFHTTSTFNILHHELDPMESYKVYYKGEGGGFPQVWAVVSLVCPSCPWVFLAAKVFQLCTNHFVLVLCRSVWDRSLSLLPSPILELQHTLLPLYNVASQGACLNSLLFRCFQFGTHIWVPQGVGSALTLACGFCGFYFWWINRYLNFFCQY